MCRTAMVLAIAVAAFTLLPQEAVLVTTTSAPDRSDVEFTVPEFDIVEDLHGDVVDPDLVVFMAGNEFMVVPDLLRAFATAAPECARAYVETLPPGVIDAQLRHGALRVGALRISHPPDVFTAGKDRIERLAGEGRVEVMKPYASNELAILVRAGNPRRVRSLVDLGRDDVRVATPDPQTEDIGRKVQTALASAGGDPLVRAVMGTKVEAGTTYVTRIHHRETPRRILQGESDAGLVWRTEGVHQQASGNAVEVVGIESAPRSTSYAAALRGARHERCAKAFVHFLASPEGTAIFTRRGFGAPR